MAIVTISRGTFAGGEQLAELLSGRLDYRNISREVLYDKVLQDFGFTAEELEQTMERAPTRFDHAGERRRRLFIAIQASLCQLVLEDRVVYHGQAGHLLLPDIGHVLRVRLIAPRRLRITMAGEREGLKPPEAGNKIDRVDAERSRWTQFVFGANWADPALYDMLLNLECMTLPEAAELVSKAVELPAFQPTEESRQRLQDLTLASQVRARLVTDPATQGVDLRVEVEQGRVRLAGVMGERDRERVVRIASEVRGVARVETVGLEDRHP
jgi:cytidylate kinase